MSVGRIVVICALISIINTRNVPDYIHICKRSDPHVAKCVRESVEFLRPRLQKGIPELNVPSIEPLRIKDIEPVNPDGNRYGFHLRLKDVDVYGVSDFQVTKLKLDIPHQTYRIGVKFPQLRLVGNYDVNARVLVPIKGDGTFNANATNCIGNGIIQGELINVNGKKHIRFTSLEVKIQIGDYAIHLDNLFRGDKILSQAAHDILHDNRKEFIEIARPFIESKVSEILLEISNNIVKDFTYDELLPEK